MFRTFVPKEEIPSYDETYKFLVEQTSELVNDEEKQLYCEGWLTLTKKENSVEVMYTSGRDFHDRSFGRRVYSGSFTEKGIGYLALSFIRLHLVNNPKYEYEALSFLMLKLGVAKRKLESQIKAKTTVNCFKKFLLKVKSTFRL